MKRAWIITQEGPRTPTEVIGILSARKSSKIIKDYVEWLYALLHYSADDHLNMARYSSPTNPYEAKLWVTNTGVPVQTLMFCGHNPYLIARLASNVSIVNTSQDIFSLKWTEPDRLICDPQKLYVVDRIPGETVQFPVNLPLRFPNQENAFVG
jgi:hypothetical protein